MLLALALGVCAAALASCGSSGKGLIPLANAGPLQSDFEAVAQAAQTGGGDCTATEAAINNTEQDFAALPASVDRGLHHTLEEGIKNLRERALALCAQPLTQTNTTTTSTTRTTTAPTTSTPAPTTPTATQTTPARTTPTAPTTPTTPTTGGGTPAPTGGASGEPAPGSGQESPAGVGESGGQEAGK